MQAGKLRQRVYLLQPSTTKNTLGEIGAPEPFAQVWARVKALTGVSYTKLNKG
jgi:head-tail adaptor